MYKKILFIFGMISLLFLNNIVTAMEDKDYTNSNHKITIQPIPTGTVLQFAGPKEPDGWLICDGRTISRSKYQNLFNVIGKTYTYKVIISPKKESEQILGEDTFCVPDMRGRVPVGVDNDDRQNFITSNRVKSNNKIGESGGEEKHQLTVNEMPSHSHGSTVHYYCGSDNTSTSYLNFERDRSTPRNNLGRTAFEGGHEPHNNMQPYLILNYIIKY